MSDPTVSDDELIARLEEDAAYIDNYEGFVGSPDRITRTVTEAAARLRSLSESKREMVEALEPFAAYASMSGFDKLPDDAEMTRGSRIAARQVTASDFKRARAVIAKEAGHAE